MPSLKISKPQIRFDYNSPLVLTYTLICILVFFADVFSGQRLTYYFFSLPPSFDPTNPVAYFRLISYIVGHADGNHLVMNLLIILLVGPMLEEKYGAQNLFIMCILTALATSLINLSLVYVGIFTHGLLGASGIAFMFILLSSFSNAKAGTIPLTFILVAILFLGQEIANATKPDNISQFAHIIGGVCGGIFGFQKSNR